MKLYKYLALVVFISLAYCSSSYAQTTPMLIDARKKSVKIETTVDTKEKESKISDNTSISPKFDENYTLYKALIGRHSTREFLDKPLDENQLANILWAANGINREETKGRTSPSAMGVNMIDIYAVTAKGIFLWIPEKQILQPILSGDFRNICGSQDFVAKAPLNLIYVANPNKYYKTVKDEKVSKEQVEVWAALEAGHQSQNVYLTAASMDLGAVIRVSYPEEELRKMLNLKKYQIIIAAQTVGIITK